MRKFKVNRSSDVKIPSKESIEKFKDFSRLSHEYDQIIKRPKKPLYKDRKLYFILLLIALLTWLLTEAVKEEQKKEDEKTEQTE